MRDTVTASLVFTCPVEYWNVVSRKLVLTSDSDEQGASPPGGRKKGHPGISQGNVCCICDFERLVHSYGLLANHPALAVSA